MKAKQTFAVIVTSRNIFPAELAKQERRNIAARLDDMGFGGILLGENDVPNGAVETYSDAKKCAALFKQMRDEIDGVIVVLPNFGDEQAVTQAIDMSQLHVPVLVQACDEADPTTLTLGKRRDSFCGKLSLCNNLYQYGIPFTNTTYHTCRISDEIFVGDLNRFAAHRHLDDAERVRRQRHPMLDGGTATLRLRGVPVNEPDGRAGQTERL
ncbi:MAG: hypothetical protein P8Z79_20165 [Sedimentisphaerales bacterium]